jgi:CelD/BcsL family acetyltransferase involved in cellulose biosynthesis
VVTVQQIDPLQDPRWPRFLEQHPRSSVFHTPEWLETLWRTYGYKPVVMTTASPGEDLGDGFVLCEVRSWLTGRRLVSVPFADHCEPLVDTQEVFHALFSGARREAAASQARYVEFRPVTTAHNVPQSTEPSSRYWLHQLDIRGSLDEIFSGLHKNCIQRKIRRAEREALRYEEGCSDALLESFYQLVVLTRRRQQLPPQPRIWFRTMIACMGNKLQLRLALKDKRPVAGVLTLRHKGTMVFKYGCSDAQFHQCGGTSMLLWRSIQDAKQGGLQLFDFGRSDWLDQGLVAFKDRWGAQRSVLDYTRVPSSSVSGASVVGRNNWTELTLRKLLPRLPDSVFCAAGSLIYPHMG